MTKRNACANCAYFRKQIDPQNLASTAGQCTRNPPIPFPAQSAAGMGIMSMRPAVDEKDWCGEWTEESQARDSRALSDQ